MDFSELEIFLSVELKKLSSKCIELAKTDSGDVRKLIRISDDLETTSSWITRKIIEKMANLDLDP